MSLGHILNQLRSYFWVSALRFDLHRPGGENRIAMQREAGAWRKLDILLTRTRSFPYRIVRQLNPTQWNLITIPHLRQLNRQNVDRWWRKSKLNFRFLNIWAWNCSLDGPSMENPLSHTNKNNLLWFRDFHCSRRRKMYRPPMDFLYYWRTRFKNPWTCKENFKTIQ